MKKYICARLLQEIIINIILILMLIIVIAIVFLEENFGPVRTAKIELFFELS